MIKEQMLDFLASQMKCEYLSDLRYLPEGKRRILAERVEALGADEYDLRQWNDALEYLTGGRAEETAEAAKAAITSSLRESR